MAAKEGSGPRSPQQPPTSADQDTADPNPSSAALPALARFEFEMGRGNEGTKILMVEWDPSPAAGSDPSGADASGADWEVSWEGKKTFLPTSDAAGPQKRVYFLLPPGAPMPPLVTISQPKGPKLATKPLPAIFPPGLGVSQRDAGKRGVLHTIWAKKRLSELDEEIRSEMKTNVEGVGLEMALQERKWIYEEFGIGSESTAGAPEPLTSPMSPRTPAGGRLGEKLKGLRLATSPSDLATPNCKLEPLALSRDWNAATSVRLCWLLLTCAQPVALQMPSFTPCHPWPGTLPCRPFRHFKAGDFRVVRLRTARRRWMPHSSRQRPTAIRRRTKTSSRSL